MIGKTRQLRTTARVEEIFDPGIGKARGVLRWPPSEGQFRHVKRRPAPEFEEWIDSYWMVQWDLPQPYLQETLPHPNVNLVFENGKCTVGGVSTKRFSRALKGTSGVFGVKFQAGGFRPFLGAPVETLQNRIVAASRVFGRGVNALRMKWAASAWDANKMIDAADAFFAARVPKPDPKVRIAASLVQRILDDRAIKTVDELAIRAGMTKRQLQRIFSEYIGIGPKWTIRRYRLHEIVEVLNSGIKPDWSQVAIELGYFDQAHLINEFGSIIGKAPAEFQRAMRFR